MKKELQFDTKKSNIRDFTILFSNRFPSIRFTVAVKNEVEPSY